MEEYKEKFINSFRDFNESGGEFVRISNEYVVKPREIRAKLPFTKYKFAGRQNNILLQLFDDGALTMSDLARREATYNQAITQPVMDLVNKGLVRRFQKEGNYRSIYIELTEKGREVTKEELQMRNDYLLELFREALSDTEMQDAADGMNVVVQALKKLKSIVDDRTKGGDINSEINKSVYE